MADFDDDGAVDMSSPKPAVRRPRGSDFDDEDDTNLNEGQAAPQQQSRPPMKGWGDSGSAPVQQNVSKAVVVESSGVSENFDHDPTPVNHEADNQPSKPGFGRRSSAVTKSASNAPKDKYDSDVITDITEIPDVEEADREQDLTSVVADAPNVRSNRVQALQELDNQIQGQLPSAIGDGIDLSILTSALTPQENVAEPDEVWQFDQLFADVSSEMQAEMEPTEKEEGEEGEEPDDENAGVARGDGKKAQPIRDRSNKTENEQKQ